MNRPEAGAVTRVIVAFDHCRLNPDALTHAVALADRHHAEIVALFIEDERLVQLANLPFSQEINRSSGTVRKLDSAALERELAQQVSALEQSVLRSVGTRKLRSSVQVVRGRFVDQAMAACELTDIVFVNVPDHAATEARRPAWLVARQPVAGLASTRPIWAVFDGSPTSQRTLDLAGDLSARAGAELIVVVPPVASPEGAELKARASAALAGKSIRVRFAEAPVVDTATMVRSVRAGGCGLFIVRHDHPMLAGAAGSQALETFGCPVVLVR